MKSNRYIHVALTVGALAAAPALAAAQTGSTGQPHQRESGTPGAAQGGSAKPQGDQAGASGGQRAQQQGQGQKKQAMKPMKLQEQISFQVEDGCTYTASVNGRIEQTAAGKSQQPSGSQPGGGSQGRGGTGAQGQTGGAAQAPGSGAHAHAGGAQGRDQDTGGVQAPAGGAQAGGPQGGSQAQAGRAQGGSQDQAGRTPGGSQDQTGKAQGGGAQGERQAQAGGAQGGSQPGSRAGDQEKVKPDLTVSASMSCPNTPELRVTDTLKTDTAVSRSELEEMISRRASIATQKSGRFCMYVPQFELTREKLSGKGIAQLCRVPAPDQKQGMR
ncbi:hypothetical protein AB3662_13850 [Sorangium cellulosum]|uniref:hypothetical protein n=1 Tax=Sorangium cellulosum TaxID=56 RepID=UPI003D9A14DC